MIYEVNTSGKRTEVVLKTPSSGELIYYVQVENGLMLSDSLATVNQGELAEHYILKKQVK